MVVLHPEMVAVVIEGDARINIVRRIDENLAIEHMGRRVGGIDMLDQRLGNRPLVVILNDAIV